MSGIYNKAARNFAAREAKGPAKMITFSVRCWDTQIEFLQKAVIVTGIPQPEYVLQAAVEKAARDLKVDPPTFPTINRRPTKGTTPAERVAKMQGLSLKEFQKKIADEMAEKLLAGLATDSAPRKAGGTTRR